MTNLNIKRRGVGLVELLLALAISALLLTATAVAVDASFKAYSNNQEESSLLQQGRMALNRMVTSIRTSDSHAPTDTKLLSDFKNGLKTTGSAIAMFQEDGTNIIYRLDAPKQRLIAEVNGKPYILARGVQAFQVTMEPMRSEDALRTGSSYDLLRRANILITIRTTDQTAQPSETTGKHPVTLSVSVSPRRNSW
ncbi:MAG TPA: prepilin-type N-terminal cleavage/methylation domain-containing protein [Tepidisphaeraceae bacterium]|jgi:prepilin-type N-terminal cleavage/methylation domain-containing protein|nr:prepilin-type N-terminal cleavage/methylation domain-containing protein [Tepidisphaeraceae bacterium]